MNNFIQWCHIIRIAMWGKNPVVAINYSIKSLSLSLYCYHWPSILLLLQWRVWHRDSSTELWMIRKAYIGNGMKSEKLGHCGMKILERPQEYLYFCLWRLNHVMFSPQNNCMVDRVVIMDETWQLGVLWSIREHPKSNPYLLITNQFFSHLL